MATTLSTDVIIPDVLADMIGPEIEGQLVMSQVAETDTTLEGRPGDRITHSRWNYTGPADILTENVPMVPRKLSKSQTYSTIKEAGSAHEITDTAQLVAFGEPKNAARSDLALSVADRLDMELRAEAEGTFSDESGTHSPLALPPTDEPFSWLRATQAYGLLGAKYQPALLTWVISFRQHIQLLQDENFQSVDKFGSGAVLLRGQVGAIGSIPVILSSRATQLVDADPTEAGNQGGENALLIRRGSLELLYKRRPVIETGRDILNRSDVLTTTVHFGTRRVDDRGIVVVPTGTRIR